MGKTSSHNRNEEARLKSAAESAIRARWSSDVEPFVNACRAAEKLYKQIDYYQGLLSILWAGKQSHSARLKAAPQYTMIKQLVPHIFHTGRTAKSFYIFMTQKHGKYSEMAEKELGISLWSPEGNYLPWVGEYDDERGMPFLEVRLVVQLASGFGHDGAIELMSSDAEFMALVREATANPAPELRKRV